MATTGVMNGTKLRLFMDLAGASTYTAIGSSTDVTLNLSHSPRETTNQDSAGYATFLEGKRVATIDFNALHVENATNSFHLQAVVYNSATLRAGCTFKVATSTTGDVTYTGSGFITSLSISSGGPEGNVTIAGSIQVSGPLTAGAVS
jgi:hypothetical protein